MITTPHNRPMGDATGRQRPICLPLPSSGSAGFSVVELMVAVTIAAILAALAVPSMRTFLQNDRMWGEQNTLVMSLNQARSEAIKQDLAAGVTICTSSDGISCSGSGNWSNGWIVQNPLDATHPLQSVPAMPTSNTLKEVGGNNQFVFLSNGTVQGQLTGKFVFCDQRGAANARYTELAGFGRIASAPSSTPGKDLNGVAVTCP
jgi:type IV fimbrial biogenesis protein FimT